MDLALVGCVHLSKYLRMLALCPLENFIRPILMLWCTTKFLQNDNYCDNEMFLFSI